MIIEKEHGKQNGFLIPPRNDSRGAQYVEDNYFCSFSAY